MDATTYVKNVRVTFKENTHKPIIFSFHHLKEQEECITAIYQYIKEKNKRHYRQDAIQSIEFMNEYVTVLLDGENGE